MKPTTVAVPIRATTPAPARSAPVILAIGSKRTRRRALVRQGEKSIPRFYKHTSSNSEHLRTLATLCIRTTARLTRYKQMQTTSSSGNALTLSCVTPRYAQPRAAETCRGAHCPDTYCTSVSGWGLILRSQRGCGSGWRSEAGWPFPSFEAAQSREKSRCPSCGLVGGAMH